MRVIVIDTGVNRDHRALKKYKNIHNYKIDFSESGDIRGIRGNNEKDYVGHGTAISYILARNNNLKDLYIDVLAVEEKEFTETLVIKILEYINKNVECDVINLSLCIRRCKDKIRLNEICNALVRNQKYLVAAFDNYGKMSYPAVLESVIGVDITTNISKAKDYCFVEGSLVNIKGMASPQRLPGKNNEMQYVEGSSFVVPYISLKVLEAKAQGALNLEKVKEYLKINASKCIQHKKPTYQRYELEIRKAIIFPYNKEMYNLIQFQDLCDFEIVNIYDWKKRGKIGQIVDCEIKNRKYIIREYDEILWESEFDTIIVGHLSRLEKMINRDIKLELLEKTQIYGKKVYMFDNENNLSIVDNHVFYPQNVNYLSHTVNFGKLYSISAPVLGVVGTSSKQGKFNLQLQLRRLFLNDGYNVGQLGTEPTAYLFGMDELFSYGYNTNLSLSSADVISNVNWLMNLIDLKNPDIIICGCQSNILHRAKGNVEFYPLYQYECLVSMEMDKVILCVNFDDDDDYIRRTIQYVEAIAMVNIQDIVLFPFKKKFDWNENVKENFEKYEDDLILERKKELVNKLKMRVYDITNKEEICYLYNSVIDFFSE